MLKSCLRFTLLPVLLTLFLIATGCAHSPKAAITLVTAQAQTEPVADSEDAADDPAIWVNPKNPQDSRVLGTNKQGGIGVYSLSGARTQFLAVGRVNNVDVRQDVARSDGARVDIAAASHRVKIGITVCEITPAGELVELAGSPVPVTVTEPYGFCLARDASGALLAAVNDKAGRVEVWELLLAPEGVRRGRLIRELTLSGQVEGMVADDARGLLYIGEEAVGIWRLDLASGELLAVAKATPAGPLVPDVEGLALAHTARGPVLFCSSQGNNTFVAYDADPPFRVIGVVGIKSGVVGSVEETDGIEICTASLGPTYPEGAFVAQDGVNEPLNQNFKIVRWDVIRRAMGL